MKTTTQTPETTPETKAARDPQYILYKPNARGTGAAFQFSLSRAKASVFLEAAAQSGEKQFDWENKIIMKWTVADLGQVLAVLQGRQPQAKLFHQSEKANSACELTLRDEPGKAPYLMTLSRQATEDKSVRKSGIPLSHAEAAVLETLFRTAVARITGW